MQLNKLLSNIKGLVVTGPTEVEIKAITADSRKVKKGSLFVAIKGEQVDGHEYISEAIRNGAVAVVTEREANFPKDKLTFIKSNDSRLALGEIALNWEGQLVKKLKIIGVTGTDGKTTTANLIYFLLRKAGLKVGLISTIGAEFDGKKEDTGFHVTSPDPISLHHILAQMANRGAEYVVLEVTSHGIDQKRIAGVNFDYGVLTNITSEHLDYHKSFEEYQKTKLNFLYSCSTIIANKDDDSYKNLIYGLKGQKLISYSTKDTADLWAKEISLSDGLSFKIESNNGEVSVKTPIFGIYNVSNILAAGALITQMGLDLSLLKNLSQFSLPEGRMEKIKVNLPFEVIVDFAHTSNALDNVLSSLAKVKKGRIIVVFGCAGERDKKKRAQMGEIAVRKADISIFTAEDPRTENVFDILAEMEKGAKKGKGNKVTRETYKEEKSGQYFVVPERHEAIYLALLMAKPNDTVIVCGKGHESSMAYGHVEHPWKDRDIITSFTKNNFLLGVVVFAAGVGKRMQSDLPKVLHKIAGRPMISYTLENLRRTGLAEITVVVGYEKEQVIKEIGDAVNLAIQAKQLGTGNALKVGIAKLSSKVKHVIALNGDDSAFYNPKTISEIIALHLKTKSTLSFVTTKKDDPTGLGRIVRDEKGNVAGIVEEKDATPKQKQVNEINVGFYLFERKWLINNLPKIKISPVNEYYVVDLIKMAIDQKEKVNVFPLKSDKEWVGVNTPEQLALADKLMRAKLDK